MHRCTDCYDGFLTLLNSLPNHKFFDWLKLKELADDNINVTEKLTFLLGRVENIVEKRENIGFPTVFSKGFITRVLKCLPAFSPFPTVFSKGYITRVIKSRDCMVKS